MILFPPSGSSEPDERGSALVASILILLVLSVLASSLYWLAQSEMVSGQAYAHSVRALHLAESGIARYFSGAAGGGGADSTVFTYFAAEDEWLLTEFSMDGSSDSLYAYANAQVTITSQHVMTNGGSTISEVTAEATVQDLRNPELVTTRAVKTYERSGSSLGAPDNYMYASTGGMSFGGKKGAVYNFQSTAGPSESGSCAPDGSKPIVAVPSGDFDLPTDKWGDCPYTAACDYDWEESGAGVDSTFTTGADIVAALGLNWSDLLSDGFYAGLPNVQTFNDSDAFEAYFDPSKEAAFLAMDSWPISRVTGDPELYLNASIKGFGLLIVDGPLQMTGGSTVIEWTGLILVGGYYESFARNEFHVRGGMITGLGCTDAERAAGDCTDLIDNEITDIKYRPCEIAMATAGFMSLERLDDLFREASPGG